MYMYEIVADEIQKGNKNPSTTTIGFIAESELEKAKRYCSAMNARAIYNDNDNEKLHNYRIKAAPTPALSIPEEVVVVDVYEDAVHSELLARSVSNSKYSGGMQGILYPGFYREIMPIIDGETKEQWLARKEGAIARGRAILSLQPKNS